MSVCRFWLRWLGQKEPSVPRPRRLKSDQWDESNKSVLTNQRTVFTWPASSCPPGLSWGPWWPWRPAGLRWRPPGRSSSRGQRERGGVTLQGRRQGSQSRRYNITVFYGSGLYFGPKVPYGCCAGHSTAHFPSHGFWREFKLMNSGNIPVFLDSKESELTWGWSGRCSQRSVELRTDWRT